MPPQMAGHVVMFCSGAVSWSARFLKVIAQSSGKAETTSATNACKDHNFVHFLLNNLGVTCALPRDLH
eukprot:6204549-Pleurochrysis_carterae.AAC.1